MQLFSARNVVSEPCPLGRPAPCLQPSPSGRLALRWARRGYRLPLAPRTVTAAPSSAAGPRGCSASAGRHACSRRPWKHRAGVRADHIESSRTPNGKCTGSRSCGRSATHTFCLRRLRPVLLDRTLRQGVAETLPGSTTLSSDAQRSDELRGRPRPANALLLVNVYQLIAKMSCMSGSLFLVSVNDPIDQPSDSLELAQTGSHVRCLQHVRVAFIFRTVI